MPFLILFIVVPVAEIWVLIEVSGRIGVLPTIALVLLTAVIGLALLRQQGVSTLLRANQRMRAGEIPAQEMAEGIFLAVGGALLLTPGFITDTIGFACLIPGVRRLLLKLFLKYWRGVQIRRFQFRRGPFDPRGGSNHHHTIDGDYRRHD